MLMKAGDYQIREDAYKEVTMGGETVYKWGCCKCICEYYNGKEVYEKDSDNHGTLG